MELKGRDLEQSDMGKENIRMSATERKEGTASYLRSLASFACHREIKLDETALMDSKTLELIFNQELFSSVNVSSSSQTIAMGIGESASNRLNDIDQLLKIPIKMTGLLFIYALRQLLRELSGTTGSDGGSSSTFTNKNSDRESAQTHGEKGPMNKIHTHQSGKHGDRCAVPLCGGTEEVRLFPLDKSTTWAKTLLSKCPDIQNDEFIKLCKRHFENGGFVLKIKPNLVEHKEWRKTTETPTEFPWTLGWRYGQGRPGSETESLESTKTKKDVTAAAPSQKRRRSKRKAKQVSAPESEAAEGCKRRATSSKVGLLRQVDVPTQDTSHDISMVEQHIDSHTSNNKGFIVSSSTVSSVNSQSEIAVNLSDLKLPDILTDPVPTVSNTETMTASEDWMDFKENFLQCFPESTTQSSKLDVNQQYAKDECNYFSIKSTIPEVRIKIEDCEFSPKEVDSEEIFLGEGEQVESISNNKEFDTISKSNQTTIDILELIHNSNTVFQESSQKRNAGQGNSETPTPSSMDRGSPPSQNSFNLDNNYNAHLPKAVLIVFLEEPQGEERNKRSSRSSGEEVDELVSQGIASYDSNSSLDLFINEIQGFADSEKESNAELTIKTGSFLILKGKSDNNGHFVFEKKDSTSNTTSSILRSAGGFSCGNHWKIPITHKTADSNVVVCLKFKSNSDINKSCKSKQSLYKAPKNSRVKKKLKNAGPMKRRKHATAGTMTEGKGRLTNKDSVSVGCQTNEFKLKNDAFEGKQKSATAYGNRERHNSSYDMMDYIFCDSLWERQVDANAGTGTSSTEGGMLINGINSLDERQTAGELVPCEAAIDSDVSETGPGDSKNSHALPLWLQVEGMLG